MSVIFLGDVDDNDEDDDNDGEEMRKNKAKQKQQQPHDDSKKHSTSKINIVCKTEWSFLSAPLWIYYHIVYTQLQ